MFFGGQWGELEQRLAASSCKPCRNIRCDLCICITDRNKIQIYKNERTLWISFCSECQLTIVDLNPKVWFQQSCLFMTAVFTSGHAGNIHQ